MTATAYAEFLQRKASHGSASGFEPLFMPEFLFDFQAHLMAKKLAHQTIVEDSSRCGVASADYLLVFRSAGENPEPITHPRGLIEYAGERPIPHDLLKYRGRLGKQTENRYSHWIWRQYASAFWDDVRIDRVLPFKASRDRDDEKHVHPLQLDVIDRAVILWSNPGDVVLTPFMGVGSEVYSAVRAGRVGVGIELKEAYFNQAVKNLESVDLASVETPGLFDELPMFANPPA